MILTVEAFKRETPGGIPLNNVEELPRGGLNKVIPNRIKNDNIYNRLQQALDDEMGLEDDDNDEFGQVAEVVAGLTGFDSTAAYTDAELGLIFHDLLNEGGATS